MPEEFGLTPVEIEIQPQVRDKVYKRLRQAIVEGRLKPGERLIERKFAQLLGVSRTPVREAIRILESEGLVVNLPRVGAVVAQVTDTEVMEVYRIRAVLEGLAARMAAEKIKPEEMNALTGRLEAIEQLALKKRLGELEGVHLEFHKVIYQAACSPRLYEMIISLIDYITRYTRVGYCHPGRLEEATREHRQLLEAIKRKDGVLAERVAREHIDNSRRAYFSEMANHSMSMVPVI
ncbi:GntR family transcriptional regulator [Desulforamulus ruminis]|uniref:GntR domain protein n=1 Tax=Desulforamulus ruminis (strain ATCC 23193 / DSM 2154 / NCIMB 8452 / DL) TaxID=696281 RepID=F6DLN7_DESRL|nr:GntR family transcriptional regulator [Desulforamulus ruminis]AEG61679.1 GntR domain protein [Desulforamulus ruminis DSM 2154]